MSPNNLWNFVILKMCRFVKFRKIFYTILNNAEVFPWFSSIFPAEWKYFCDQLYGAAGATSANISGEFKRWNTSVEYPARSCIHEHFRPWKDSRQRVYEQYRLA